MSLNLTLHTKTRILDEVTSNNDRIQATPSLYNVCCLSLSRICWGLCEVQVKPFENVKDQIGYCGLWCGSCTVGNGTLKELTKRYEHIIGGYGVDKWGAEDQGFDGLGLMKTLKSVQEIPICRGCLKGGGATNCKIRACASKKKLSDCNKCNESTNCRNREALQKVRTGALAVGMIIKTDKDKTDQNQLAKKWTADIRNKFPCCVIDA